MGRCGARLAADERRRTYPVNPNHPEIGGVPAYPTITDIPDEIGLAIVAVPADALAATIDQCIEKRVRGAVIVTSLDGVTGVDMPAIVANARSNGLRIVGPGSMGIASPRPDVALQAALVDVDLPSGNVAVSMQSGTLGSGLLQMAGHLQLPMSWFVSLGDKSDVSGNDLLQFWEDDEATSVIAIYSESLGNPGKFARIARRVSLRRPIVTVRTGTALSGEGTDALYAHTGVIEVPTVTALLDTVRTLATQPLMNGRRVCVVSNSKSPTVLATGSLVRAGLEVGDAPATAHVAQHAGRLSRCIDGGDRRPRHPRRDGDPRTAAPARDRRADARRSTRRAATRRSRWWRSCSAPATGRSVPGRRSPRSGSPSSRRRCSVGSPTTRTGGAPRNASAPSWNRCAMTSTSPLRRRSSPNAWTPVRPRQR